MNFQVKILMLVITLKRESVQKYHYQIQMEIN